MAPQTQARSSSSAFGAGPATEITHPVMEEATRLAEMLASQWRHGQHCPAEELLAGHPAILAIPQAALRVVYEEVCQRQELGQDVSFTELSHRFPQWHDQLTVLLDCVRFLGLVRRATCFPLVGETLGEFRILAEVGRGGRGRVYLAEQAFLAGRLMILKLIPLGDREHLKLARVQHTHVVPLYSARDYPDRNLRTLVMPCLGGASLGQLLHQLRALPPEKRTGRDLLEAMRAGVADPHLYWPAQGPNRRFLERATYVQAVCWTGVCLADALHFAHEQGLIHLDVKPSNVLLTADCQPMLLDFHLAQQPIAAGAETPDWLGGTQGYMSPEQQAALRACREQRPVPVGVDARSDVYSLGLLLREALYGELPQEAGVPARKDVSAGLRDVLSRCLCADPAGRYASAAAVAEDLRRHLTDRPLLGVRNRSWAERWQKWRRRRPQGLLVAGLVTCCLAAAVGWGLWNYQEAHAERRGVPQALEGGPQAAEEIPQEVGAWYAKGAAAYGRGHYDEAVTAFSVCIALAPDGAKGYYDRGLAYAALGDAAAALRDYDRALQLDPQFAAAALNRGGVYLQQQRFAEAESDFRLALESGADPVQVYYNLALLHQARREPAAALDALDQALRLDPDHGPSRDLRAVLRRQFPPGRPLAK